MTRAPKTSPLDPFAQLEQQLLRESRGIRSLRSWSRWQRAMLLSSFVLVGITMAVGARMLMVGDPIVWDFRTSIFLVAVGLGLAFNLVALLKPVESFDLLKESRNSWALLLLLLGIASLHAAAGTGSVAFLSEPCFWVALVSSALGGGLGFFVARKPSQVLPAATSLGLLFAWAFLEILCPRESAEHRIFEHLLPAALASSLLFLFLFRRKSLQ